MSILPIIPKSIGTICPEEFIKIFLIATVFSVLGGILGYYIGALFFDLWGAETSIKKGLIGIGWTALFLIFLFLAEKKED